MTDKIFVKWMNVSRHEKAPDFVKANIGIKVEDLKQFLDENVNEKWWLNIDIKESKNWELYAELNTYKREVNLSQIPIYLKKEEPKLEDNETDMPF